MGGDADPFSDMYNFSVVGAVVLSMGFFSLVISAYLMNIALSGVVVSVDRASILFFYLSGGVVALLVSYVAVVFGRRYFVWVEFFIFAVCLFICYLMVGYDVDFSTCVTGMVIPGAGLALLNSKWHRRGRLHMEVLRQQRKEIEKN